MKQVVFLSCVLLACMLFTRSAVAEPEVEDDAPPTVRVYLLAGQSNMQGVGKVDQLPWVWREPMQRVAFWDGERFEPLDPQMTRVSSRRGDFGPELGFAWTVRLMRPDSTFLLVKFYRSGQPLHHGWDGNRWVGGEPAAGRRNFYSGESSEDEAVGEHYRDMLEIAQAAFASVRAEGYEPVLAGVVWMQGEQDAKHEVSAEAYAASLARLKRRIEEDLGSDPVPFVFGQVLAHEPALPRFTHREVIRERMAQADMHSGDDRAVDGVWMVPTEGMPLNADTVHYNTEGQMLLGMAFGLAMMQAQHATGGEDDEAGE